MRFHQGRLIWFTHMVPGWNFEVTDRTPGFSEPEQLTQRKSKRLIEGFVCNPLLSHFSLTGSELDDSTCEPPEASTKESSKKRVLVVRTKTEYSAARMGKLTDCQTKCSA